MIPGVTLIWCLRLQGEAEDFVSSLAAQLLSVHPQDKCPVFTVVHHTL